MRSNYLSRVENCFDVTLFFLNPVEVVKFYAKPDPNEEQRRVIFLMSGIYSLARTLTIWLYNQADGHDIFSAEWLHGITQKK